MVLTGDEYRRLGTHTAAAAAFLSNFVLGKESGYFDGLAETKPLLHLWSLGVEEQFYIVWPFLLGWAWRSKRNFLTLTALIAATSFVWNIYSAIYSPVAAFYSPLSRFWELMLGAMLAYFALHKSPLRAQGREWLSVLGLMFIALSTVFLDRERMFPAFWALLPDAGAFLVISAGPDAWLNRKFLGSPLLVRIGLMSYPLYLWHWPLLPFAQIMGSRVPSIGVRAALVLTSILLAGLTYELIENPYASEEVLIL
jgi:peptidoglycan/LPS O-acetylase OafA/YrhL